MKSFTWNGQCVDVSFPKIHQVSRLQTPEEYGGRFIVPESKVPWDLDYPGYLEQRRIYIAQTVLDNYPIGWAMSDNFAEVSRDSIRSYGELRFTAGGYPMNPVGRTGFGPKRGLLGHWGANFAADPMITWLHPEEDAIYLLAIDRHDGGGIALPGGMEEFGQTVGMTLKRELGEETGVEQLDMEKGRLVYCGYSDDWRNSDHAWMETIVVHRHVSYELAKSWNLRAGDDARRVFRLKLTSKVLANMYANHGDLVRRGLLKLASEQASLSEAISRAIA